MAVGVKIDNNGIYKKYDYYIEDYYYLETTTPNHKCGYIPNSFSNPSELYIYPIEQRSFVIHNWKEGHITKITGAEQGDFVKVVAIVENLGNKTAENVNLKGVFYSVVGDIALNSDTVFIGDIEEFDKKKVVLSVLSPNGIDARFESQIIINGLVIDTERSENSFS
jgi:hypothetical protein